MRFQVHVLLCLAFALLCAEESFAQVLFESNVVTPSGSASSIGAGGYRAKKFTLASDARITSVEGFLYRREDPSLGLAGELKAVVFSDGEDGLPNERIFEERFFVPNSYPTRDAEWRGAFELDWRLPAGTYWAAFVVDNDNLFGGGMPYEISDNASYAAWLFELPESGGPSWDLRHGREHGFRVTGMIVPEPACGIFLSECRHCFGDDSADKIGQCLLDGMKKSGTQIGLARV